MSWFRRRDPAPGFTVVIELPPASGSEQPTTERDKQRIIIPTDLMFTAWRQLFPAERMIVFGGRKTPHGIRITSASDVSEAKPSAVHVRACQEKIAKALVDFECTGAHLAIWMHSHPGDGPNATHPSGIDLNQDRELRQHYSERLVSIIAVRDGWLRLWGPAVEKSLVKICWRGQGIEPGPGERHVYRLKVS